MAGSVLVVALALAFVNRGVVSRPTPSAPPRATPSATASALPGVRCQANQIRLEGAFNGCADAAGPVAACFPGPAGDVFGGQGHLRDRTDRFILYLEVDGGFHGPGTYPLVPWPQPTLGSRDGIAKVAVREFVGGAFWQSIAGSLTIQQDQGLVYALLAQPNGGANVQPLEISGVWYCG